MSTNTGAAIITPRGLPTIPQVGRRFWHAHKVVEAVNPATGRRDPELCKITKITSTDIHYRVGINPDGTGGGKWFSPSGKFADEVLRFAYDAETVYARLLACGWCFEENGEEAHPHPECAEGLYPEHAKQHKIKDTSQAIFDFVEFARNKGFDFGRTVTTRVAVFEGTENVTAVQPIEGRELKELLAEHFGIDLARLADEKDQMVADMAAMNTPQEN